MPSENEDKRPKIDVIIPAFNEEGSIAKVIGDIPEGWVREVVVVSNGSTDDTERKASEVGATVVREYRKGYGYACLKGMSYLEKAPQGSLADVIVFLDGDYSDFPEEMPNLLAPIIHDDYDMVIGSRATGAREKGSMTYPQVFGNWLATNLIRLLYQVEFTDLGPFRAIKFDKLLEMDMKDKTYGWTVEMQVKAAKLRYKCMEVPVNYRKRIGKSKVSGTVKGTILAGYKILTTIFRLL